MAAKSSNLVDETSGASLQEEGYADMPSQSEKDPWELEALDSSPFSSPSWSPAQRPLSSHPNMKYCLEIWVTLMEELGSTPTLQLMDGPLVEDMLHDARTGFTKAGVTGPGRAVLFYQRCSMGEGLTTDEARDAVFLLTGAGMWVGKLAYLTTGPMTIQEGKRAIAQAVSDCWVKERGPGHPHVNLLAQQPFQFDPLEVPLQKMHLEIATTHHHPVGPLRAKNIIGIGETRGLDHLGSLHLPQIVGLRMTGVCYWLPQFHPGLTGQMDQDVPEEVDSIEKKGLHMKINLPILKDKDAKDAVAYQSQRWDLTVYQCAGCRDWNLLPYPNKILPRLSWRVSTEFWYGYNLEWFVDNLGWTLLQCEITWCAESGAIPIINGRQGICVGWGVSLLRHLQVLATSFPDHFPPDCAAELKRIASTADFPSN